jgi:long-subunit fatty acid transport protein
MYLEDIEYFEGENGAMSKYFRRVNNIRVGGEIKPLSQLSIRAGYNFLDTYEEGFDGEIHYVSAGIGYLFKNGFFLDAAYRQQCNKTSETYQLYQDAIVDSKYGKSQLLLTLGFKF